MVIDKLVGKIKETENPSVIGLDPRLESLPGFIIRDMTERYGETPKAAAEAIFYFNREIIDKIFDTVPAVKPQIAFYEQYGADGIAAYQKTAEYASEKGLIVIGDIKRGDIAATASAYSNGHIGRVRIGGASHTVYREDFITVNPYLGRDAMEPFLADCAAYGKGLFVLVKTSNAGSGDMQDLITENGPVYEHAARLTGKWGEGLIGESGYSLVGAVVGATHKNQAKKIRELLPETFFLIPGYGAQGASAEDLLCLADKKGAGFIANSSRGIIFAYADGKYNKIYSEREFGEAARAACLDMKEDISRVFDKY